MSNLWIRACYSVLLAMILTLTVGFGVTMLVTEPHAPDTPSLTFRQLQTGDSNAQQTDQLIGVVDRFFQDTYDFRRDYPDYQRNILIVTVLLAMVVGAAGIVLGQTFNYLRLGLLLAALLLLVWATSVALAPVPNPAPSDSSSVTNLLAAGTPPGLDFAGRFLRFAVSFVALLVILFLGLWRLTAWNQADSPSHPSSATSSAGDVTSARAVEPDPASPQGAAWRRPNDL